MKTSEITVTRSYTPEIRDTLAERGYTLDAAGKKVVIGKAKCRTFETLAEVQKSFDEKTIIQYVNEKAHVLDKESFSQSILESEGLKVVSPTSEIKIAAMTDEFWGLMGGADDQSGVVKTKHGNMTYADAREKMAKIISAKK